MPGDKVQVPGDKAQVPVSPADGKVPAVWVFVGNSWERCRLAGKEQPAEASDSTTECGNKIQAV